MRMLKHKTFKIVQQRVLNSKALVSTNCWKMILRMLNGAKETERVIALG